MWQKKTQLVLDTCMVGHKREISPVTVVVGLGQPDGSLSAVLLH